MTVSFRTFHKYMAQGAGCHGLLGGSSGTVHRRCTSCWHVTTYGISAFGVETLSASSSLFQPLSMTHHGNLNLGFSIQLVGRYQGYMKVSPCSLKDDDERWIPGKVFHRGILYVCAA